MPVGSEIAIEIGRHHLRAVQVRRLGRIARVKHVLIERFPKSLDVDDAVTVGSWIGEQLSKAGFPRGRAMVSLPRERVALKRLDLPTNQPEELAEMTRLAMRRELPLDPENAVIDFVPLRASTGPDVQTSEEGPSAAGRGVHAAAGDVSTLERLTGRERRATTQVLAVAVPAPMLAWTRRALEQAGMGLQGVSLRSLGTAALMSSLGDPQPQDASLPLRDGATLAIDIAGDSLEISVIASGSIRFSRAPELPELTDPRALAEAVITETRRTWMSYRVAQDQQPVSRAVLIGDPVVCRRARAPIAELLGVEAMALDSHPMLDAPANLELDGVWPLCGLLLADALPVERLDLASPRKAPDLAARKRQQVLAAAAVFILAAAGAWTVGHQQFLRRQRDAASLQEQARAELPAHDRFQRDAFKLQHLERWQATSSDWLGHAQHLLSQLLQPQDLVLDGLTGNLSTGPARWSRRDGWSTPAEVKLVLEGEARQRLIADNLRDQLVRDALYEVNSTGAETVGGKRLPHGFTFNLRSGRMSPPHHDDGSDTPDDVATSRQEHAGS